MLGLYDEQNLGCQWRDRKIRFYQKDLCVPKMKKSYGFGST